ncbi:LOW QUALITY PROTEIN: hypothetical protein V2J09_018484 [Rumex salicifolius]
MVLLLPPVGYNSRKIHRIRWRLLTNRCFIGGDFNVIVSLDECGGDSGGFMADSKVFSDLITRRELIDMGFFGSKFTWGWGPAEAPIAFKRLDRFLMNIPARLRWDEAVVRHLPISLRFDRIITLFSSRLCRTRPLLPTTVLSVMWLTHPEFVELINSNWLMGDSVTIALAILKEVLCRWNKDTYGNLHFKKNKLLKRIQGIDNALNLGGPDRLLSLQHKLIAELENILLQKEIFWFQKPVAIGLIVGIITPRFSIRILALKDSSDSLVTERMQLKDMVVGYFAYLYMLPMSETFPVQLITVGVSPITNADLLHIVRPVTDDKIWSSVRRMQAYKAPGVDGFQPVFYHNCWDTVRESVNETIIHLTGKVANSEYVSQFRLISLCNVMYKMITKILALRLQPLMSNLVGPMQSSFIPGRFITDNIIVVQELVHSMKRKTGRKGWMLLKLDLEKTYDRIIWDFIEDTLPSESQMTIIMDLLDRFCMASGQRVSNSKSTIFVSANVDQNVSGMTVSTDMGSYLGMPFCKNVSIKIRSRIY